MQNTGFIVAEYLHYNYDNYTQYLFTNLQCGLEIHLYKLYKDTIPTSSYITATVTSKDLLQNHK